jgi:hypothetical protein
VRGRLLLGALLLAGCGGSHPEPPHVVPWHLAGVDGRTLHLTVRVGGPPCEAVRSVSVRERPRTVAVVVRAGQNPGAKCGPGVAAVIATFPVTVHLREPLGARTLLRR